ncbi:MAG TPA: hypothetical protein VFB65_04995 [Pyrinomonadaceae bacterium]|nr:hypothetical protein [Pyrinomonadaceae bacterium]
MKYTSIVETKRAQAIVIGGRDARGIAGDLYNVVEHRPILFRDWRGAVVLFQRGHER